MPRFGFSDDGFEDFEAFFQNRHINSFKTRLVLYRKKTTNVIFEIVL